MFYQKTVGLRGLQSKVLRRWKQKSLAVIAAGAVLAGLGGLFFSPGQAGAAPIACTGPVIAFGRQSHCGFYDNLGQTSGNNLKFFGMPDDVDTAQEFIDLIVADLNSGLAPEVTAAQFIIHTMIGRSNGAPRTVTPEELADWQDRVRSYANVTDDPSGSTGQNGSIAWKSLEHLDCGTFNTFYQVAENDAAPYLNHAGNSECEVPGFTEEYIVFRDNAGNAVFEIRRLCMNPARTGNPLAQPRVSIGNFVWFDANNDGVVNESDATSGVNGVTMNLYNATDDTDGDGFLSAAELAAATALATTQTATDARGGATNGLDGYYQFTDLAQGRYIICTAASNFGAGGPLLEYLNSPVPSGVGDTQTDTNNHGSIPAGGTLLTDGTCSTTIDLRLGQEPTDGAGLPDDDTDNTSDYTIDFGFWHGYSLGNRVWCDTDNSGAIDANDGMGGCPSLGLSNVSVALMDCQGTTLASTTTDADGYYRFDDLNAGCYKVTVLGSNFDDAQPLAMCKMSSSGLLQEADPDNDIDGNDNGIDPESKGLAVMSGEVHLGPGGSEPAAEVDLAASGQGTTDGFANMTLDFGFNCERLAKTGDSPLFSLLTITTLSGLGGAAMVRMAAVARRGEGVIQA